MLYQKSRTPISMFTCSPAGRGPNQNSTAFLHAVVSDVRKMLLQDNIIGIDHELTKYVRTDLLYRMYTECMQVYAEVKQRMYDAICGFVGNAKARAIDGVKPGAAGGATPASASTLSSGGGGGGGGTDIIYSL